MGWFLLVAGLVMNVVAVRERGGGDLENPRQLTTRGLHGFTRNPMYVGFSAIHLGVAMAWSVGWMLATWPVSFMLLHRSVLFEEQRLSEQFGEEYAGYQARTPRYLGRRSAP